MRRFAGEERLGPIDVGLRQAMSGGQLDPLDPAPPAASASLAASRRLSGE